HTRFSRDWSSDVCSSDLLTGIASTFIGWVISIGKDNLFLSLVLTMITCLVLGMGIPTIPNYIITSSLAGPALLELGVPLLVSHKIGRASCREGAWISVGY